MRSQRKPNLFIVGAPKSGTTAMYRYLSVHPEVFMAYRKEMHYFGSDLYKRPHYFFVSDETQYLSMFNAPPEARCIVEASVNYLLSKNAAAEIMTFNPDARVLIMLRNPVDMLYSYHSQLYWGTHEELEDFEAALAAEPERRRGKGIPPGAMMPNALFYREVASYSGPVARYFDVFGRDAVHVILFDDFRVDPEREFMALQEFLGLTPFTLPRFRVVNPNMVTRFRPLMRALQRQPWPVNWLLAPMPDKFRYWFIAKLSRLNSKVVKRPPMPSELRKRLTAEFAAEIGCLGELLDRDLSSWLKTAD